MYMNAFLFYDGLSTFCSLQILSSLRIILTLPPLSSTSNKAIRDIHRQVSSGVLELLQAHSSDLHTPSEWSVIFSVMEFAGAGLMVYEKKEDIPSSSPVATEIVTTETGMQGVGVTPEPSVHIEHNSIDTDWVWVEEMHLAQLILPNSFDLLSTEPLPIHDPQVSCTSIHM